MNWKEAPHLFANGKFKLKTVEGFIVDFFGYKYNGWALTLGKYREEDWDNINGCQLIARKIEDMTDEDINYYMGYEYKGSVPSLKEKMILTAKNGTMIRNGFLRLLELGVYPFDQNDFETGEVLDAKEAV